MIFALLIIARSLYAQEENLIDEFADVQVTVKPAQFVQEVAIYKQYRFVVEVKINNQKYRLGVNTSQNFCTLNQSLIEALNLQKVSKRKADYPAYLLPSLQIKNLTFENIIVRSSTRFDDGETGLNGLIGTNLLAAVQCQLDFPNKKLVFASLDSPIDLGSNAITTSFKTKNDRSFGTPIISLYENKNYIVDAAILINSPGGVRVPAAFHNQLIATQPKFLEYFTNRTTNTTDSIYNVRMKGLSINNDILLEDFFINSKHTKNHAYLGQYLLSKYCITINWRDKKITFANRLIDDTSSYGFYFTTRDGGFYVDYIFKNSPAYKIGMKVGDQLIEVNDLNVEGIKKDELEQYLTKVNNKINSNRTLRLWVKRGDKRLEFLGLNPVEIDSLFK